MMLNGLNDLCPLLLPTQPDIVQRRGLFALGALLRGQTTVHSMACPEFYYLMTALRLRSPRVQLKTATLITDLAEQSVNKLKY